MHSDQWRSFLKHFSDFGREPSVEAYLNLFDADGTVLHPGIPKPLADKELDAFISSALTNMGDFQLHPIRWCGKDDTLFVEARCAGTIGGLNAVWPALYCVTLRGDRVLRGRAYYDRAAVLSYIDPELARRRDEAHARALVASDPVDGAANDVEIDDPSVRIRLIEPYIANWQEPRPEVFLDFYTDGGRLLAPGKPNALARHEIAAYYAALFEEVSGLRQRCQLWASLPGLLFVEWRMSGKIGDRAFEFGSADRFSLQGDRISEGVSYFDTLTLHAAGHANAPAQQTIFTARN